MAKPANGDHDANNLSILSAAAGVANITAYNGFFKENGVIIYLATPHDDSDLKYKAYKENDLIDDVIVVPGMYEDDGRKQIAEAVKTSGVKFGTCD